MLIAAYAGCGKSTAAQELGPDVLDLSSMPYRWLLPQVDPDKSSSQEREREKGELHHIADPRFPYNYVLDILKAEREGKTVMFPTIVPAIDMLAGRYGRDVLVVCPEDGLREEYRQRYLERGNSGSFLDLFVDEWKERLESIRRSKGRHLALKSGEYLLPVLSRLLAAPPDRPEPAPVPEADLEELEREIAERGREQVLWICGFRGLRKAVCLVEDLDLPPVREALEAIGRAAFERGFYPPRLVSKKAIFPDERAGLDVVWTEHLSELYQIVSAEPIPDRFPRG